MHGKDCFVPQGGTRNDGHIRVIRDVCMDCFVPQGGTRNDGHVIVIHESLKASKGI
jgi:hypothetical protein